MIAVKNGQRNYSHICNHRSNHRIHDNAPSERDPRPRSRPPRASRKINANSTSQPSSPQITLCPSPGPIRQSRLPRQSTSTMFHLTPQGRALAGIGIVVSIIALMTLCCVVFYLCLTHPETTGTRDGDAEYAKAREHWHEKQRRRKAARKASKERKRQAKLQKKAEKKNPDHRHNKCACNESDTLEYPRQCSHQSPQSAREFELERLEEKTYINLDCLRSPTDKDGSHLYESVHDRDGSLYEVYFTARDRTYNPSDGSTDESNLSSAPSIPEQKSNVTFEIGSSTECITTMEPDYDNTSYIYEQTAIEPSESASSIKLFRTPVNTSPSSPDSMYDVIRKHVATDLNSTFHGFPTSHENDAFSDSSSCGMYSLPH